MNIEDDITAILMRNRLLGLENAKLAMRIHKQREAFKVLARRDKVWTERHAKDAEELQMLRRERDAALVQLGKVVDATTQFLSPENFPRR